MTSTDFIMGMVMPFYNQMKDASKRNKDRLNAISNEYHKITVNLPRKKKKARRKELQIEWNFIQWIEQDNIF